MNHLGRGLPLVRLQYTEAKAGARLSGRLVLMGSPSWYLLSVVVDIGVVHLCLEFDLQFQLSTALCLRISNTGQLDTHCRRFEWELEGELRGQRKLAPIVRCSFLVGCQPQSPAERSSGGGYPPDQS